MTSTLRLLSAEASDRLGLQWATVLGASSGQCSCRLGIWAAAGEGEPQFTVTAWQWTPEEMLAAMYGRFLLESAIETEGSGG